MSTPGVANLAVVGRHRKIAGRHQLAAGCGRDAVHRRDHRLRAVDDRLHHRAARRHDVLEVAAAAVGVAAPRGQFLQVVAGAEGRTVRGDDDCADGSCPGLIASISACSAAIISSDRALRAAGRLSVSSAMLPCASRSSTAPLRTVRWLGLVRSWQDSRPVRPAAKPRRIVAAVRIWIGLLLRGLGQRGDLVPATKRCMRSGADAPNMRMRPVCASSSRPGGVGEGVRHQQPCLARVARPCASAASAIGCSAASSAALSTSSRSLPSPCGFMPPRNR